MPWCPKCNSEYRDGYEKCEKCGEALIEKPEEAVENVEYEAIRDWSPLTNVADEHEADLVESILQPEGIPVRRKHREAGGVMAIYMGMSRFGIDLFVPADKLELAQGLLNTETIDMPEVAPEDDTEKVAKQYEIKRRSIVWTILAYLFLPVVILIIMYFINR
ncbi:MAG: hypothetical protein ACM3TR_20650 [Caulobacteraceae bacterium]